MLYLIRLSISLFKYRAAVESHNKARKTLDFLDYLIETCVLSTNQSFVEPLKQSGCFMQQDKEEAFQETLCKVNCMLNKQKLLYLNGYIGSIDEWISNKIEYHVRKCKGT